jgi:thiol-disulfide isomerase/thioredoxin
LSARRWGVPLLVALLLAGCSASPSAPPAVPAAAAAPEASEASEASAGKVKTVVPASLRFTGKTLDGKAFDAATLAGKPAILWFWAPWCATCASEAMSISDVAEKYRGRLNILGIAGMGNNADMHEFVTDLEVGAIPHLDDEAGKLWKRFKITQQSWYVLVDRAGEVVKTGYLDDLQLTSEVKSLVA